MKTKWKKMEKKDATITTTSISCFFLSSLQLNENPCYY